MAIPDYQTLMLPLLKLASDGQLHAVRDSVNRLADQFELTEDERQLLFASGSELFAGRVGWARTYLKQAGLLAAPRRGTFKITDVGSALLATDPQRIDNRTLLQYSSFVRFITRAKDASDETGAAASPPLSPAAMPGPINESTRFFAATEQTPEEAIASADRHLRESLEAEVLDRIKQVSPAFFERLVIDVLVTMGYGGTRADAGRAIGKSGDGGIDGIINEDRLGLDVIYVQAKRWEGTVGRPEIQKFAGALQGQRATKGVFITTSTFTREARDFAGSIALKIILIDGERLAALMVEHDVGVARIGSYVLKRLDNDYFDPA
ncbi:MAG: restriction endonuclease [Gammaproteobacteria bacterium]|nr:restriction endonuclease [Gammaproteobacteria bacterium]